MEKKTIKETIIEYDDSGRIIRQTVTETIVDDDENLIPPKRRFWYQEGPTCADGSSGHVDTF